jgi:hypothetical protein
MIGLRPGLQAFRAHACDDTAPIRVATVGDLPNPASVAADTVALVGADELTQVYRSTGVVWLPERLLVATVGALPATASEGAIALAGATSGLDSRFAYAYEAAAWSRVGSSAYAWPLSSIANTDPSGCGVTETGDYGVLNGRLYRLTAPLALPGGGTRAFWVTPEVYAGTCVVAGHLVGTEAVGTDTTLNAQGWTTVVRTNGAITSQSTRVRLATSTASATVSIATLTSGVTPSTRVYLRTLMRAAVGTAGTTQVTTVGVPAFGDGSNFLVGAYLSENTAKGTFFWTGSSTTSSGVERASQAAVAGLAGPDDLLEVLINTVGGLRTCEMWRNGVLVSASNVVSGAFADQLTLRATAGSAATQTATLDLSHTVAATW